MSLLSPCNDACPAGENIQQWLYDAEEGGLPAYEAVWRQIMNDNPFPAIMGPAGKVHDGTADVGCHG